MKKLFILINIFLGIIILIIAFQLSEKNKIIDGMKSVNYEIESEYLEYQDEINIDINKYIEIINMLKQDFDQLMEVYKKLELENEKLIKDVENLNIIDIASIEGLKHQGINDYNIITEDLFKHTELIPFDGVLGGRMQFTNIYLLNDKWVYAIFEDGHIQGYGLYEFSIDKNKNISWKIIDSILD